MGQNLPPKRWCCCKDLLISGHAGGWGLGPDPRAFEFLAIPCSRDGIAVLLCLMCFSKFATLNRMFRFCER